jgi:hypothetical protein
MQNRYLVGSWADQRQGIQKSAGSSGSHQARAETLNWALGRRPSGELRHDPSVRPQAQKADTDLYELARLLRGDKPEAA